MTSPSENSPSTVQPSTPAASLSTFEGVADELAKGVTLRRSADGGVTLRYRRGTWGDLAVLGFVIGAILFLQRNASPSWIFAAILTVGFLPLFYFALGRAINSTKMTISKSGLSIEHGPLFWGRAKHFAKEELSQLSVLAVKEQRGKSSSVTVFNLHVETKDGKTVPIITAIPTMARAKLMEKFLEDEFGLEDKERILVPKQSEWSIGLR